MSDTEDREDDWQMRDSEVALMDAIKVVLEILIAAEIASPSLLHERLSELRVKYAQRTMENADIVIHRLVQFVNDPRRAELREQIRHALLERPKE